MWTRILEKERLKNSLFAKIFVAVSLNEINVYIEIERFDVKFIVDTFLNML